MEYVLATRTVFGIPVQQFTDTIFKYYTLEAYRSIYAQCTQMVNAMDPFQMLIQDSCLEYLDLAVKPCFHCNWSRKVKFEAIRHLPLACGEYLLAETESPASSTVGRAFRDVKIFQQLRVEKLNQRFSNHWNYWFRIYSSIFFERFEGLDGTRRRTAIRGLMNAYRILRIETFRSMVYQSMIRECTSRELDPVLTIELLGTLCINNQMRIQAFLQAPNESLEIMLCHAKAMQFDFWGLWRGIDDMSAIFNPVAEFTFNGNNPGARILLKYGFPYLSEVESENSFSWPMCRRLKHSCRRFMSRRTFQELTRKLRWARFTLTLITFNSFDDLDGTGLPADSISTLVCLMRCVPEPYVHPTEMNRQLKQFYGPAFHNNFERIVERYRTAEIYVGEDHTILKPRRLEHLCRCAIRRTMANNLRLPEGIEELGMPPVIKDILLLES